eukprot:GDKJ01037865.1.p1 GENE.GDKJ01037865.1~~GDKJ01037865.1.p1  ORF type:complete len:182 (-),score=8.75 GDKJ01037865.1:622-1167(-)
MEQNENIRSLIIGKNLNSLLLQTGITITGLAYAIDMSVNHLRTIRLGKASISSRTAGKISDFFEIDVSLLFSSKPIKLKNFKSIDTVSRFYEDNSKNKEFFVNSKEENSLMFFLRKELLKSDFLKVERDVKEIKDYCIKQYQRNYTSKALSAQLLRLSDEGYLEKSKKFENNSVYLFKLAD